jgi:hypothetical protein
MATIKPPELRFSYGAFAGYANAAMTDRLQPKQCIANTKQALIAYRANECIAKRLHFHCR